MHFLDITPLNQLQLLNHAMSMDEPLLIRYSMTVLLSFRRRVRTSVCPFKEGDMEIEEYYILRGCLNLDSLSYYTERLKYACPLSTVAQTRLTEWLDNIITECIDDCPWTSELQAALDLFLLSTINTVL